MGIGWEIAVVITKNVEAAVNLGPVRENPVYLPPLMTSSSVVSLVTAGEHTGFMKAAAHTKLGLVALIHLVHAVKLQKI